MTEKYQFTFRKWTHMVEMTEKCHFDIYRLPHGGNDKMNTLTHTIVNQMVRMTKKMNITLFKVLDGDDLETSTCHRTTCK